MLIQLDFDKTTDPRSPTVGIRVVEVESDTVNASGQTLLSKRYDRFESFSAEIDRLKELLGKVRVEAKQAFEATH
jgi:hypothetical protein